MPKMKPGSGLYKKYTANQKEETHQQELRKKHNIQDESVKVVEKPSAAKYLFKIGSGMIRWTARILIFLLVAVALITLAYPSTRNALENVMIDLWIEIKILLRL